MKKDFIFDICISALIGMFVGMLFMVLKFAGPENTIQVLTAVLQSGVIGIIIGSIAEYMIYPMTKGMNKYVTYIILFFENAVLTFVFSWIMGVRQWQHFTMMIVVVEILALNFYRFQIKYKENLNKKLEERKSIILKK